MFVITSFPSDFTDTLWNSSEGPNPGSFEACEWNSQQESAIANKKEINTDFFLFFTRLIINH